MQEAKNCRKKKPLDISRWRIGEIRVLDGPVIHMHLEGVQDGGRT